MVEDVKKWIKDHKKEILIACGVTVGVVITIVVVKNHEAIEKGLEKLLGSGTGTTNPGTVSAADPVVRTINVVPKRAVSVEKVVKTAVKTASANAADTGTINLDVEEVGEMMRKAESVGMHLRRLPVDQHASAAKIAEAAELDIDLKDIYTLVDGYTRTRMAA